MRVGIGIVDTQSTCHISPFLFQSYELEKERHKREELAKLSEEERTKEKEKLDQMDKKHKVRRAVNFFPGSYR